MPMASKAFRNSAPSMRVGWLAISVSRSCGGGSGPASSAATRRTAVARRRRSPSSCVSTVKSRAPGAEIVAVEEAHVWSASNNVRSNVTSRTSARSPSAAAAAASAISQ